MKYHCIFHDVGNTACPLKFSQLLKSYAILVNLCNICNYNTTSIENTFILGMVNVTMCDFDCV